MSCAVRLTIRGYLSTQCEGGVLLCVLLVALPLCMVELGRTSDDLRFLPSQIILDCRREGHKSNREANRFIIK